MSPCAQALKICLEDQSVCLLHGERIPETLPVSLPQPFLPMISHPRCLLSLVSTFWISENKVKHIRKILQHLASIVRVVPVCLIETSGFGKKHKWQNLNKSNSFEMKTIPYGSSLTSFPCMFNLKDIKSVC